MTGDEPTETLIEEREAEIVSFPHSKETLVIKRTGLFLKPTSKNPTPPSSALYYSSTSPKPPTYHPFFRWWADPQPQWRQWVERLTPKFSSSWLQAGIYHAIMASKYKLKRDLTPLSQIVRFWSSEVNTFLFPWGEATLTLEDVVVLGGFNVLGEPVRSHEPLADRAERETIRELKNFYYSKYTKSDHSAWLERYMGSGRSEDKVEHAAFLILWLSRFVFPASDGSDVRVSLFELALRMARGVRFALAPAVLAGIYRGLTEMKQCISAGSQPLSVWAPFNVLQLWVWERFPSLRPGLGMELDMSALMSVLESGDEFRWRPYSSDLENECRPSFYLDDGGWFCSNSTRDKGLQTFLRCLRPSVLVGFDCIEPYHPHRVGMQFGLDQDIPGFAGLCFSHFKWEEAWSTYDICSKNVKFYVAPRTSEGGVTLRYSKWWSSVERKEGTKKRKGAQDLPESKKLKGLNATGLSACPALRQSEIGSKNVVSESREKQTTPLKGCFESREKQDSPVNSPYPEVKLKNEGASEYLDEAIEVKLDTANLLEEKLAPDQVNVSEVIEGFEKTSAGELHYDLTVIENSKGENRKQEASHPQINIETVKDFSVTGLSACAALRQCEIGSVNVCSESREKQVSPGKSPHSEEKLPLKSEEANQYLDEATEVEVVSANQLEKKPVPDQANASDGGLVEAFERISARELHNDLTIIENLKGENRKQEASHPQINNETLKDFSVTGPLACAALRQHRTDSVSVCPRSQEQQTSSVKSSHSEVNMPLKSQETTEEHVDETRELEGNSAKQLEEKLLPDQVSASWGGVAEASIIELHYDQTVTENSEKENGKQLEEASGRGYPQSNMKHVKDSDVIGISVCPALRQHEIGGESICCKTRDQQPPSVKSPHSEVNLPLKSQETTNQNLDDSREPEVDSAKEVEEKFVSDLFNAGEVAVTNGFEKTNTSKFHHGTTMDGGKQLEERFGAGPLHLIQGPLAKVVVQTNGGELNSDSRVTEKPEKEHEAAEIEERNAVKELERDLKIKQLKEEIASIRAKVTYLESLAQTQSKEKLVASFS